MPGQIVEMSVSSLYDLSQLGPALESVSSVQLSEAEELATTPCQALQLLQNAARIASSQSSGNTFTAYQAINSAGQTALKQCTDTDE